MNGRIAALMEDIKREAVLAAWPVGSIYTSTEATSPATLFGGTWERIKDRFLLAAGDDYAAGSTGGEASVTLTVDQIPGHTHSIASSCTSEAYAVEWPAWTFYPSMDIYTQTGDVVKRDAVKSTYTGNGYPHNNLPPYLAVYAWKRTA